MITIKEIRKRLSAYDRGWLARKDGRGREANPYPVNEDEHVSWDMGWTNADVDSQTKVRS